MLERIFVFGDPCLRKSLLEHLCSLALQQRLRSKLSSLDAIAFVADGSILPRNSGTSDAPMASPPAVPFRAPCDSKMTTKLSVEIPSFLGEHIPSSLDTAIIEQKESTIEIYGLLVPKGITLICGGGYHGEWKELLESLSFVLYAKPVEIEDYHYY